MTTNTKSTKSPAVAAIVAARKAGHDGIAARASSIQADASDWETRWNAYLANPLSLTQAEAMALFHEHQALQPMAAAFDPAMLEFQLRAFDERFFLEEVDECIQSLNAELAAALVPQPGYLERLTKWLTELPGRIYAPSVNPQERQRLIEERDYREDAALALEHSIASARAAIVRFETSPTPEYFGQVQSAISFVKTALA